LNSEIAEGYFDPDPVKLKQGIKEKRRDKTVQEEADTILGGKKA
jgi:hypothetical protein